MSPQRLSEGLRAVAPLLVVAAVALAAVASTRLLPPLAVVRLLLLRPHPLKLLLLLLPHPSKLSLLAKKPTNGRLFCVRK